MTALDVATRSLRAAALRTERASQSAILATWTRTLAALSPYITTAIAQAVATQSSQPAASFAIASLPAVRALAAAFSRELAVFGMVAGVAVQAGTAKAAELAPEIAGRAIVAALGTPPPGAVVPNISASALFVPNESAAQIAGTIGRLAPGMTDAAAKAIADGVRRGMNPRAIAREVQNRGEKIVRDRAFLISRESTNRAFRESSLANYRANREYLRGWRWLSARGPRTCGLCFAMDGKIFDIDEPFASHPACFTAGHVVSGPRVLGSTVRWYEGDVIEILTTSQNLITVTPNHPILTPHGWVAAGLLNEGSEVISARGGELPLAAVNPNEYQQPALIEDVARSFGGDGAMVPISVPTTALDFHGDGGGSEVCVIRTNGLLRDALNPSLTQPFAQQDFGGRDMSLPFLASERGPALLLESVGLLGDTMGGLGVAAMLFGGAGLHHQAIRCGTIADFDTRQLESTANDGSTQPQTSRDAVFGLTGLIAGSYFGVGRGDSAHTAFDDFCRTRRELGALVTPKSSFFENPRQATLVDVESSRSTFAALTGNIGADRILNIRRRRFSGHVYNLQTTEGWYTSNGIITHNCRCVPVPISKDLPGWKSPEQPESGREAFARLSAADQRAILGSGKMALYLAGELDWDRLVQDTFSPIYGPGRREAPLKALRGAA